ncbi:MAG: 4-(cytidine 5'-diphospho)-2-C-methyl-D-erythritol kinase [Candidatus Krumholzibacteriota bacterium]|nr:4-(cytidine 5'-diphospho)-2-C-methyl-D-erythritol kinase [Candidatus Krumholzibacteriota bacterium]
MSDYDRLTILCAAKVNLYLEVLGKRPDGYHDILTFFHPVSLYDRLELEKSDGGISLSGSDPDIPWDDRNLCWKAAGKIFTKTGFDGGVRIKVAKAIPSGAGLGGGSSDAAAVLYGLNRLYSLGLEEKELTDIALELGSDIPFFLGGRPAVGRGRGEILDEVPPLREGWIIIAKPEISISTGAAYENLKLMLTREEGIDRLNHLLKGLKEFPGKVLSTFNSFEGPQSLKYPEIAGLLKMFKDRGAELSSLSGSGAACFALFSDRDRVMEVKDLLLRRGFFAEITQPVDQTFILLDEE